MITLKDHQQAIVALLANQQAIPASSARLAHALHDTIAYITGTATAEALNHHAEKLRPRPEATSPGLNELAVAGGTTPAEVAHLRNQVKQFKGNREHYRNTVADLAAEKAALQARIDVLEAREHNASVMQREIERAAVDAHTHGSGWIRVATVHDEIQLQRVDPQEISITYVCRHSSWEEVFPGSRVCCDCGATIQDGE